MVKYEGKMKIISMDDLGEAEKFLSEFKDVEEGEKLYVSVSNDSIVVRKLKKV